MERLGEGRRRPVDRQVRRAADQLAGRAGFGGRHSGPGKGGWPLIAAPAPRRGEKCAAIAQALSKPYAAGKKIFAPGCRLIGGSAASMRCMPAKRGNMAGLGPTRIVFVGGAPRSGT